MKWFYNLKIAVKLLIAFIMIAIMTVGVGIIGIKNIGDINNADTEMYEKNTVPMQNISDVIKAYDETKVALRDMLLDKNTANQEQYVKKVQDNIVIIKNALKEYSDTIQTDEQGKYVQSLEAGFSEYEPYTAELIDMIKVQKYEEAYSYMQSKGIKIAQNIYEPINSLFNYNVETAKQKSDSNDVLAKAADNTMIAIIIGCVVVSILLSFFISNAISKPVKIMVNAADKLALGDVAVKIEIKSKDEIGILADSFRRMIDNIQAQARAAEKIASGDFTIDVDIKSEKDLLGNKLSEMTEQLNNVFSEIASASEQVASGSKQISDSSIALSQGATEQASSVEELTASLEQISAQTRLNAENASNANNMADKTKDNAVKGNDQMKEMLKAMDEINISSNNISKIIKVIDDIAFQTNILALNAAVEAARAGQHGKGFAVVSEEVRNLAARSANAAKETTDLIEGSIKKVEGGTKLANETAQALNKIVEEAADVSKILNEIATASNEQAIGIEQINQGIMQISEVVQTNSATSEEGAAASEELSSQAALLNELVSKVKLKKNIKTYSKIDEISPEVLKMLENMSLKRKTEGNEEYSSDKANVKSKIILSDKEFGKY